MRDVWLHRPFAVMAVGMCTGLVAAGFHPWAVVFLAAIWAVAIREKPAAWGAGLVLSVLLFQPSPPLRVVAEPIEGIFRVVTAARIMDRQERFVIEADGVRYRFTATEEANLSYGDTVAIQGRFLPLPEGNELYWLCQGIAGDIQTTFRPKVLTEGPTWARIAKRVHRSFVTSVRAALEPPEAAVAMALCFNADHDLDPAFTEQLIRTGTIHIISTSGLHVMLLAAAIWWLGGLLPVPRVVQVLLIGLLLLLYVAAAGLHPPAVRAVIMAMVFMIAHNFQREADALSALGLSCVLTLLWNPQDIYSVGFQMSYLVLGTLIFFGPQEVRRLRGLARAGEGFWVSLRGSFVASLAVAPITAWRTGIIPIVSVIANIFIAPLVAFTLMASLAGWLVSLILPSVGMPILRIGAASGAFYLRKSIQMFDGFPLVCAYVPMISGWAVVALFVFALTYWRPHVRSANG